MNYRATELVEREAAVDDSGRGKVLLMDDEEIVRSVVGEMLRMFGHEVECARDGEEAVRMFLEAQESESPFSAVIVDLNVPNGMGGKEAVERIHKIDSGVKAVVSSGCPDDPIMTNFREYGFHAVISKPFRVADLSDTLRQLSRAS